MAAESFNDECGAYEMHSLDGKTEDLMRAVLDYSRARIGMDPPPLDGPRSESYLEGLYGGNLTEDGIDGHEILRRFVEGYAPATLSADHPRYFAFVPTAPTKASVMFDLIVSASSVCGTSWLEAAGTTFAENEALRWLADLAGLGADAGGVFVSGGSAANLSGIYTGKHQFKQRTGHLGRFSVLASRGAHSSVKSACDLMDIDVIVVEGDSRERLTGEAVAERISGLSDDVRSGLFGVIATAGMTNTGVVDDLDGIGKVAEEEGLWFHVDGAYGAAALASTTRRHLFNGIERADSMVVDPHKWLFAPYDCAALLYKHPEFAAEAHTQKASYLDDINDVPEWNPASYAYHLTRRVRGLPFWFSLATYGFAKYREAIDYTIGLADWTAEYVRNSDYLELAIDPDLSVVVFRRVGWSSSDYERWCQDLLDRQLAFVLPTTYQGERLMRFCFVNPKTTVEDVRVVLETMK